MPLSPIALKPGGSREVIDEEKARAIITSWRSQLETHQSKVANADELVLCDTLSLSDKSYTAASARIIADFLTSSEEGFPVPIANTLKFVDLHDVIASQEETVGLEVLQTFSEMLSTSHLIDLDLSDNAMGSKGVTACATILGGAPAIHSLERLTLCNNGLSSDTMNEVADLLTQENDGKCIAMNLSKLHFFNNMSGNEGCIAFERIMTRCTNKLADVRFSGTRARVEGSKYITNVLKFLSDSGNLENLTHLDLADNTFCEHECYECLADAIKSCVNLSHLNINDCSIGDDGIQLICNALVLSNAQLQELIMGGNEITAFGAKAIAKLVKNVNKTLVKFSVEDNELTSRGIKRIVDAFGSDSVIQHLVLNSCECGIIGGEAILGMAERLNEKSSIRSLELNGNAFPEHLVEKFEEIFGNNLSEMDDNDEEEDFDADLEEESEDEEERDEEHDEQPDDNIDDLANAFSQVGV